MPELPEVETILRQIEPVLRGKRIEDVGVFDPRLVEPSQPRAFSRRLRGRAVEGLSRRGKYLRFVLDSGETLVLHLRMTGVLSLAGAAGRPAAAKHLRMLVRFSGGSELAFYDTRRFGTAFLLAAADSDTYWRRLGPEPLDRSFNQARMLEITSGRSRPIKNLLLDQSLVAGIGNIYADESLFLARIHPLRPAGSLTPGEAGRLVKGIKETLRRAIRLQGSSIDTYRDSRGRAGRFQDTFRVHRREGKPCPGCGGTVKKTRVGGRGTYYCPSCQHL